MGYIGTALDLVISNTNRKRGRRIVLRTPSVLSVIFTSTLVFTAPAWAQDPDSTVTIDPVLVRVLRSSVGTGTPHSVSVVTGSELTRGTAGAFLEDALRAMPGVQIHNRFNLAMGERLSVRGFGSRAQFGVRGVRVLVDGIPATLPDGQATLDHLDLAGLGRIEALRGPSSSLYGNAAGGVLHFRSLDPATEPALLSFRSTSGSHGLLTLQGVVSGQSGNTGYRVGVSRLSYDGFRRDPIADDGSIYAGGKRSVVNASLTLPAGAGRLRIVANGVLLDAKNPGSLSQSLLDEGNRQAYRFNVISRTSKDVKQGQAGATWTGPLGGGEAEISSWVIKRELDNPIPGKVVDLDRKAGGMRALFQDQTEISSGRFGIGAGFELELQSDERFNWKNSKGERGNLLLEQLERVRGTGLFMQGRLDLDAGPSLLAGLRYDRLRFSATDRFISAENPDDSGERVMDALSPSAGLLINAGTDVEVFASVSGSFETPTTTEIVNRPSGAGGFNPDLEPQKGFTLEGGIRSGLGDQGTFEFALFQTKLTGELVPFEVPTNPGLTYYQNAGRSLYRGWEASLDTRLGENASTRIAYTRVDGSFKEFITDDADYSGNKIPGLAPHRVDGLFQVDLDEFYVALRGLFQADIPVDNGGQFTSESFFVADARLGVENLVLGSLEASPFVAVQNVFDAWYNSSVIVNAFGKRFYEPGPGRTFLLGLGITWGN